MHQTHGQSEKQSLFVGAADKRSAFLQFIIVTDFLRAEFFKSDEELSRAESAEIEIRNRLKVAHRVPI